ncbi:MAG: hypothetical protein QF775_01840 [archaeon]|jgi:hypothetical protein|nr:hypothetical protein [archaeon]
MHKTVQKTLNSHEKNNPHEREMNDLAIEDMMSLQEISPAKPFAMHVGYSLDGHHKNRDLYGKNYDYLLKPEEKKEISEEIFELSELAAMLHDPEYIADSSHDISSENHSLAREVLEHHLNLHGPEKAHDHLLDELKRPLLDTLLERSTDDQNILHQLLSPKMVNESKHQSKDYSELLKAFLTWPAFDGHQKDHWKRKLPEIFKVLQGEKNG